MQPSAPAPDPGADAVLSRIAAALGGNAPDFARARQIVRDIDPSRAELRARAEQLVRLYRAARPASPWHRLAARLPARWRPVLLAVAALALAVPAAYRLWPGDFAPTAARDPYPLPVPLFESDGKAALSLQHGRLIVLHVLPAADDLGLDGDLSRWDTRGQFHSAWAPPYDRQHYVDGCLLMSPKYLYVGARVGDPWPLRSSVPGAEDTQTGWEGGSLQLRLATGEQHPADIDGPYPPDRLVHLTLWHRKADGKSLLRVGHGALTEPTKPLVAPQDDFDAHFAPAEGGYMVKRRLPWGLLGLTEAPFGRSLGFCWETTWSDRAGERCVGKLTEFFDPNRLRDLAGLDNELERLPGKQSYQRPVIWGKALCAPKP
jgi:hypothetical protein